MAVDPLVLVVGSEGKGLSRLVRETCDLVVAIPMHAATESLNAGVAAGDRAATRSPAAPAWPAASAAAARSHGQRDRSARRGARRRTGQLDDGDAGVSIAEDRVLVRLGGRTFAT